MTLLLPKEDIPWERAVEQLVQQHHTDLQRLWRRIPQRPQLPGIPLTGISFPGDPDEFGSQATFGPYSGSPYSGAPQTGGTFSGPPQTLYLDGDGAFSPAWDGTYGWITSAGGTPGFTSMYLFCGQDPLDPDDSFWVECRSPTSGFADAAAASFTITNGIYRGRDDSHILRVRHQRMSPFSGGVEVRLKQGGTLIQGASLSNVSSPTTEAFTVTNASSISNYSDLYIEFATLSVGTAGTVRFMGASLEIP